jgi:hypothetical protein
MTDITKYTPLKTIVAYWLDENSKSEKDFDKAWVMAFRALIKIGNQIAFEPMTVRLPVNTGNMTVTLPAGYIKWTKLGIINGSGEVCTLKINNSLTFWRDTNPNRLTNISPDIPDQNVSMYLQSPFFYNYYFGSVYSPYFGIGGGLVQYGDVRVDEANNIIVLDPQYGFPDILLEYIGSPQKNNDYQIQTCCQEAVISFLNWKFKLGTSADYYAALIEARRSLKPITLQEIQQAIRENTKYALKS